MGRFEGDEFEPALWKPRVPGAAVLNVRADDQFWAARRVVAFTDEMIRAIVKTGAISDPAAETYLADVLIKRRDKIGRAFLPAINPIVDPMLSAAGVLTFANAAVDAHVAAAPEQYRAVWFAFDNITRESTRLGETTGAGHELRAPAGLSVEMGRYVRVEISATAAANPSWAVPIQTYFKRTSEGWKLVGLERMED